MPECFECTTLAKKALYKYSSFPFSLYVTQRVHNESRLTVWRAVGEERHKQWHVVDVIDVWPDVSDALRQTGLQRKQSTLMYVACMKTSQ